MFWHASVHPSICLSTGGVPISHNALQHFPECHEAAGGVPSQVPPLGGTRTPRGVPSQVPPRGGTRTPPGGYLTGYPPGGTWTPPGGYPDPPGGVPGPPRGVPDQVPPPLGGTRTPPGGYLDPQGGTRSGTPLGGVPGPPRGVPSQVPPRGGTRNPPPPPPRTEGVLTTRRAVCLLRSRRRTFLFNIPTITPIYLERAGKILKCLFLPILLYILKYILMHWWLVDHGMKLRGFDWETETRLLCTDTSDLGDSSICICGQLKVRARY